MPCALDPLPSSAGLSRQRPDIATFAQSFTTKELIATNGTFDTVTAGTLRGEQLCVGQVCVTESQFMAVFSQTDAAATAISVPSSPSNISEVAPPESVSSSSTPDTASASPEVPAPEADSDEPPTEEISASATPDAANDNDATPADQPEFTEPANDNPPPAEASATGTE